MARTYDYFIHWNKDPVLIGYSSFYDDLGLDLELIWDWVERREAIC